MSYQVLARKWRPRTFEDMVGQELILRTLVNALKQQRLHHAYLFTGTRGVGKTTLARLMAKSLNCETGMTSTPCGTCHACSAIDQGQFLDLFEVDAASRTKVEDTRELLENVLYPPTQGRYKIYLIDEVHMLSNHSFNALLKTLEEPPAHVIFLLATTDPKRLPITILSRCLQFHLKQISQEQIVGRLKYICEAEKVHFESTALEQLAKAAQGSMRDALSLLDQTIAYGNGALNLNDVRAMLGCTSQEDILPLLQALANQDSLSLFNWLSQLALRAPDFQRLLEELITIFHHLALFQLVPNVISLEEPLVQLSKQFTPEEIQLYYQIALLGRRDLSLAPNEKQGFEMMMLRMLAFQPNLNKDEKINIFETKPTVHSDQQKITVNLEEKAIVAQHESIENQSSPLQKNKETIPWRELLSQLELSGMAYALASNCTLEKMEENKIFLALSKNHAPMFNQKLKERIAEALTRHFKKSIQLEIHLTTDEIVTPFELQQHEKTQSLQAATQAIMQDSKIKQFIELYDATVEVSLRQTTDPN